MLIILKPLILGILIILFLVILDFILAFCIRLAFGKFDWTKFLDFIKKGISPYLIIWVVLSGVSIGVPYLAKFLGYDLGLEIYIPIDVIIGIIWTAITAKEVASIIAKFKELGLEIKGKNNGNGG